MENADKFVTIATQLSIISLCSYSKKKLSYAAEIFIWGDAVDFLTKSLGMSYSVITAL